MNNEVSSILRLNGWAGRTVLGFYGLGTTVIAIANLTGLTNPVIGIVALALLWAGLAILGLIDGEPLGMGWTIAIVAIVSVAMAITSGNVPDPAHSGFATWPVGAMTFLLFVLALRGRRGYAWLGFAVFAAVLVGITVAASGEFVWALNSVGRQAATLVIGTLFAIALRRATQSISAIQASQLKRSALDAATSTATRERAEQNAKLQQDARPALERIISPEPFSPQDLRYFSLLQSTLRDGGSTAGFSSGRIVEAIKAARGRGLLVTLLDDRGTALPPADQLRVEDALLAQLGETREGSIIALLAPQGRDEIATIVVEESGRYRRVLVTPRSTEVSYPVAE